MCTNWLAEHAKQAFEAEQGGQKHYVCDGCGMKPLVGVRYNCAVCDDFDYCTSCYRAQLADASKHHGGAHAFTAIASALGGTEIPTLS